MICSRKNDSDHRPRREACGTAQARAAPWLAAQRGSQEPHLTSSGPTSPALASATKSTVDLRGRQSQPRKHVQEPFQLQQLEEALHAP